MSLQCGKVRRRVKDVVDLSNPAMLSGSGSGALAFVGAAGATTLAGSGNSFVAPVRLLRYSTHIRFACARSDARKSGWAIAISACARCLADLPRNCATPYSVTT